MRSILTGAGKRLRECHDLILKQPRRHGEWVVGSRELWARDMVVAAELHEKYNPNMLKADMEEATKTKGKSLTFGLSSG